MKKLDAFKCFALVMLLSFGPFSSGALAADEPTPEVGKLKEVCAKQDNKNIVVTGSLGVKDSCTNASATVTGWEKIKPPNMLVGVKSKRVDGAATCAQVVMWAPFALSAPYQPVGLVKVSSSSDAVDVKLSACSNTQ